MIFKAEHPIRCWATFLLLLLAATTFELPSQAAEGPLFHPNRVLIIPKEDRKAEATNFHEKKNRRIRKQFPGIKNLTVVELPHGQDVLETVKEYQESGLVEVAEPDYLLYKAVVPDDPKYLDGTQWHLNKIKAAQGWDIRREATNIIVAVIDTGIRMTHEDLAPILWRNTKEVAGNGIDDDADGYIDNIHGINSIDGSGNPSDEDGHGTHVAGIVGAAGNNSKGGSGVAWNLQLMPLKFIDSSGSGATSDGVECVNFAIKKGAHVINASFGTTTFSSSLQTAISNARAAGIVFVAAAGNERSNNDTTPTYPASYTLDNIISVCGMTSSDTLDTAYSNFGTSSVDIGAPGTAIYSCGIDSDSSYAVLTGTSMASPVVAGVVALMKAQFPSDTPAQIRQRLIATADPLPSLAGKCVSGGRVNLENALLPFVSAAFSPSTVAGAFPLTVRFTNQSVGEITGYRWDFGDGSESVETDVTHVFEREGSYTVTLTATGVSGGTSIATRVISALPSYAFKTVAYEWIDPTNMTPFTLADNGVSGGQDLPFPFYFYGQPKTQIYIGANGLLGFESANMQTTGNSDIPASSGPNGTILPYWDNLNPASAGAVYAGVVGTAPNRRYVVSWVDVVRNSNNDHMTFQAALHETTGEIQFNYLEVNPASNRGGGLRATVGVEDPAGVVATKYCYNGSPNRIANEQSVLFSPTGNLSVRFRSLTFVGGVFGLEIPGEIGKTFVIEASTNLRDWTEVQRDLVGVSGVIPFTDTAAAEGNRFFRAQILP